MTFSCRSHLRILGEHPLALTPELTRVFSDTVKYLRMARGSKGGLGCGASMHYSLLMTIPL